MKTRVGLLAATTLAALAAAVPAAGSGGLLEWQQAGGIVPCVAPGDANLIEAFDVSGLLANRGIVRAAADDRFRLELSGEVYDLHPPDPQQPPDPTQPPDPALVSTIPAAQYEIEPLREDGLRAGNTVELATMDLAQPPDPARALKQLLDAGHTLRVDITATLVLVDSAGQTHVLDEAFMQTTIEPAATAR
jgi:hypothetical protein